MQKSIEEITLIEAKEAVEADGELFCPEDTTDECVARSVAIELRYENFNDLLDNPRCSGCGHYLTIEWSPK